MGFLAVEADLLEDRGRARQRFARVPEHPQLNAPLDFSSVRLRRRALSLYDAAVAA
jgi:hypothetical protein